MKFLKALYKAKLREHEMKSGKHSKKEFYISMITMIVFYALYFLARGEDRNNPFWWSLLGILVIILIIRMIADFTSWQK